jgi:hypothetical protein
VNETKFIVIHKYGRPWFYLERSIDLDWTDHVNGVKFELVIPVGLKIHICEETILEDIPWEKITTLVFRFGIVILQGFPQMDEQVLRKIQNCFGITRYFILSW